MYGPREAGYKSLDVLPHYFLHDHRSYPGLHPQARILMDRFGVHARYLVLGFIPNMEYNATYMFPQEQVECERCTELIIPHPSVSRCTAEFKAYMDRYFPERALPGQTPDGGSYPHTICLTEVFPSLAGKPIPYLLLHDLVQLSVGVIDPSESYIEMKALARCYGKAFDGDIPSRIRHMFPQDYMLDVIVDNLLSEIH